MISIKFMFNFVHFVFSMVNIINNISKCSQPEKESVTIPALKAKL